MTEERTPQPQDEVEDLDVPAEESEEVKGGVRKAGKDQQEFLASPTTSSTPLNG